MDNIATDEFEKMSLPDRVDIVTDRLGGEHSGRIKSAIELFDAIGSKVFLVVSPFGDNGISLGNSMMYDFFASSLETRTGTFATREMIENDANESYMLRDDSYRNARVSIKDFNITPNITSNSATFVDQFSAEAYMMYRKLTWEIDPVREQLIADHEFWIANSLTIGAK
jgi:hypothetical protein